MATQLDTLMADIKQTDVILESHQKMKEDKEEQIGKIVNEHKELEASIKINTQEKDELVSEIERLRNISESRESQVLRDLKSLRELHLELIKVFD